MNSPKLSVLFAVLALGSTTLACNDGASTDAPASESNLTDGDGIDVAKGNELLAKAIDLAEKFDKLGCGGADPLDITLTLRQAVQARNTVYFRTQVVAKNETLAKVMKGDLDWQEYVGNYDPNDPESFAFAISQGVSFYDGGDGISTRIDFEADGKATIADLTGPPGSVTSASWSVDAGKTITIDGKKMDIHRHEDTSLIPLGSSAAAWSSFRSVCR